MHVFLYVVISLCLFMWIYLCACVGLRVCLWVCHSGLMCVFVYSLLVCMCMFSFLCVCGCVCSLPSLILQFSLSLIHLLRTYFFFALSLFSSTSVSSSLLSFLSTITQKLWPPWFLFSNLRNKSIHVVWNDFLIISAAAAFFLSEEKNMNHIDHQCARLTASALWPPFGSWLLSKWPSGGFVFGGKGTFSWHFP